MTNIAKYHQAKFSKKNLVAFLRLKYEEYRIVTIIQKKLGELLP